jgi:hypothetical protein
MDEGGAIVARYMTTRRSQDVGTSQMRTEEDDEDCKCKERLRFTSVGSRPVSMGMCLIQCVLC